MRTNCSQNAVYNEFEPSIKRKSKNILQLSMASGVGLFIHLKKRSDQSFTLMRHKSLLAIMLPGHRLMPHSTSCSQTNSPIFLK